MVTPPQDHARAFAVRFVVVGAISMGASRIKAVIDGLGFMVLFAYAGISALIGILESFRG